MLFCVELTSGDFSELMRWGGGLILSMNLLFFLGERERGGQACMDQIIRQLQSMDIYLQLWGIILKLTLSLCLHNQHNIQDCQLTYHRIHSLLSLCSYGQDYKQIVYMPSLNKTASLKTTPSASSPPSRSRRSFLPVFSMKKLHTIAEQPLPHSKQHLRYDTTLFHKTIFHLRPLHDNPEIFIRQRAISSKALLALKEWRPMDTKAVLPHPIQMKLPASNCPNRDKMLREVTLSHITAKKWIIFSMHTGSIIKGYKYRLPHAVASISKLLTFYTAYEIVKEYFISISTFDLLVTIPDNRIGGTRVNLSPDEQTIMTLQQALFALIMTSANNIALTIANNLGSFILKKKVNRYFSCFDIPNENREVNIAVFVGLMSKYAKEMQLADSSFTNPHGMTGNISSAFDVAKLASQCFKIPLFCKISSSGKHIIRPKEVNEEGEVMHRACLLENTNKLLSQGCLGGKTGSSIQGGDSFVGCFDGGVMVVVLGSAGRTQKFKDCMRLVEWMQYKLSISPQRNET